MLDSHVHIEQFHEEGWGWVARAMRFNNGEWLRIGMVAGDDAFVGKNNSLKGRAVRQF